jgi:hypothetical protein
MDLVMLAPHPGATYATTNTDYAQTTASANVTRTLMTDTHQYNDLQTSLLRVTEERDQLRDSIRVFAESALNNSLEVLELRKEVVQLTTIIYSEPLWKQVADNLYVQLINEIGPTEATKAYEELLKI